MLPDLDFSSSLFSPVKALLWLSRAADAGTIFYARRNGFGLWCFFFRRLLNQHTRASKSIYMWPAKNLSMCE